MITCGIDEVGRGALAGPLVLACISFKSYTKIPYGIIDSKKTTFNSRNLLLKLIKESSFISYYFVPAIIIDNLGINKATNLACEKILNKNRKNIDIVLLDGNIKPSLGYKFRNIIKGDTNYVSIAAASIVAKQLRDKYMQNIGLVDKRYGWCKNVGYGTKEHLKAIKKYGITKYHRKTYKPVKDFLNNDE